MSNISLISIAMATYNGEKFLIQQLDSILSQTYSNLEIVISDDNSTDNTQKILLAYANRDSRIRLFFNDKNIGLVKNFEKAISLCSGEYIALADQDDIWIPEKIEILLKNIANYDLIHSDAQLVDENNILLQQSFSSYAHKVHSKDFLDYLVSNNVTGCTCMFSKSILKHHLPFPEDVHVHDWWLAILASQNNGVIYLHQPLTLYRQHSNNQIGALSSYNIPSFTLRQSNLKKQLKLLKTIHNHFRLNAYHSTFLNNLIQYHEDYFAKNFRVNSFLFHLVNFQKIYREKPLLYRFISLLLSFFGYKIQKKIWP